jgi:hypothetical protein
MAPRFAPGLLSALTLLGIALPVRAADPAFKYPSGRVHYKLTGPMMNGTTILTWTDRGKKFRQDMSGVAAQGPQAGTQFQTWSISDGKFVYTQRPGTPTVLRMKLPKEGQAMLASATPFAPGGKDKGKLIGKARILGKQCEIRQLDRGAKLWVWDGLPLRMEMTGGANMTMAATKIEVPARVDPGKFKVPSGYKIEDFKFPAGAPGRRPAGK